MIFTYKQTNKQIICAYNADIQDSEREETLKMIKSYEISHVILSFFKDEERKGLKSL